MKTSPRFVSAFLAILFTICMTAGSSAQEDNRAAAIVRSSTPGYVRVVPRAIDLSRPAPTSVVQGMRLAFPPGATSSRAVFSQPSSRTTLHPAAASQARAANREENFAGRNSPGGGTIDGINTVPTFVGAFAAQSGPSQGQIFPFIMMGNHPLAGGSTVIPDKISEVSLILLNADGSLNVKVPFGPFEDLTLGSPNFVASNFRSGNQIQFADAIQRAEFFNRMAEDWHTVLDPRIVNRVTLTIPRFVNVTLPDGTTKQVQAYFLGTAPNSNHTVFLLDLLFDNLISNEVISEIHDGNFTTDALNSALLPNTFLFSIDSQGNFSNCCIIGFHTFFFDPSTTPENVWIFAFASWTSPGLFSGFVDVTALSHEISESFNDPLLSNLTPDWEFPGSANCQSNLETGDPVEVLPNDTVSIRLRDSDEVFTFHPQTEALFEWFEMGNSSNAIDGAFSFPNETALPRSATPCP
jgi:hypothetical protein